MHIRVVAYSIWNLIFLARAYQMRTFLRYYFPHLYNLKLISCSKGFVLTAGEKHLKTCFTITKVKTFTKKEKNLLVTEKMRRNEVQA